ncbi:hypothetical protein BAE44_0008492 [Dichanthelium oligosanthes]|uniref:Bet v I/Major latex protein domain-containing protein n=1 Tax=Dichanthelium oligosanthes TaxID=888268 RepID=A0A1E5VZC7_9POAL|nr:hypothetical protein BAE44_0008492 [Dichanthelium oligosanthes]
MVAGSITHECAVAVSAERLWKAAFAGDAAALDRACAGLVDSVEVEGDGAPGSVTTMRLNPAAGVGVAAVFRNRLVSRDAAARVVRTEVLEGGPVSAQLRTQVAEVALEDAGEGACVARVTVEYERLDGAPLAPEDQARLAQGYLGLIKKVEAYLVANPGEFA